MRTPPLPHARWTHPPSRRQIQVWTDSSDGVLDFLARSARDDLAVAEIEGMTGQAAAVATSFATALESAKEAASSFYPHARPPPDGGPDHKKQDEGESKLIVPRLPFGPALPQDIQDLLRSARTRERGRPRRTSSRGSLGASQTLEQLTALLVNKATLPVPGYINGQHPLLETGVRHTVVLRHVYET
ncbi:hypothetical protein [Streptomyces liangshanensis]|uniref:hypothetical protein n=1 Tax=Streptomyces liangshanensis TaxID=2717324 RepID=UPI0036DF6775